MPDRPQLYDKDGEPVDVSGIYGDSYLAMLETWGDEVQDAAADLERGVITVDELVATIKGMR